MPRLPHLRVIVETEPHTGRWNMAVDEALLETAISAGTATLRFYEWSEPTVSLGYFQRFDDLKDCHELSTLPAVRRLSGGGTILHDDELTYSIALPAAQTLFALPHELYDIVHEVICRELHRLGFPVICRGETAKRTDEPMLCFQRQNTHDVTLSGIKVLGSAQRRRRGAILQHGSLIRRASPLLKNLFGIADLSDIAIPNQLPLLLATSVSDAISELSSFGSLETAELESVEELCEHSDANIRIR